MHHKVFCLLGAPLIAAPMAAMAQTETLNYSEGAFSGSVILNLPLPQNGGETVTPSEFNFSGLGFGASYNYICAGCGYSLGGMGEDGSASLSFTTQSGKITAWDISINYTGTPGTNTGTSLYANLSNLGDTLTQQTYGSSCQPPPGQPSPCQPLTVNGSGIGSWTTSAAPEIDPASAAGALALLLGGLTVLYGRRELRIRT